MPPSHCFQPCGPSLMTTTRPAHIYGCDQVRNFYSSSCLPTNELASGLLSNADELPSPRICTAAIVHGSSFFPM